MAETGLNHSFVLEQSLPGSDNRSLDRTYSDPYIRVDSFGFIIDPVLGPEEFNLSDFEYDSSNNGTPQLRIRTLADGPVFSQSP